MSGRMLVNLGGGSVDISVITMGNIAVSNTVRVGGIDLDKAISRYLQRNRDILIGPLTAERLKICLGSAIKREEEIALVTFGKSGLDNMPISFEITSTEIFNCIEEQLEQMINGIKSVLEKTPPELIGDISDNGILLTGGTALLFGMEKRISEETGIEVKTVKDTLYNTMNGVN
jgi:rod shape-determining protein MreB